MFALAVQVPLGAHEVCVDRIAPRPIQIYVRKWDLTLSWTGAVSGCLFESYDLNNVSQSYFSFFFLEGSERKAKLPLFLKCGRGVFTTPHPQGFKCSDK